MGGYVADRQDAGSGRFTFFSSARPLFLGKYMPFDAWWPEACLLAQQPWSLSGIFSDAARKIDCLPALGGCPQSRCILHYLCQRAHFPSHTSSPHRQKHTFAICVLIYEPTYTYANAHTHTCTNPHTHKLQPIFIQMNWLFHACMISIPPLDPISMLMKLWIYSINASKHTGVRGVYYNTADEWLHGFHPAIIIVITVIIWPPFGHFSRRATFIPGSISVWSDAGMTRARHKLI